MEEVKKTQLQVPSNANGTRFRLSNLFKRPPISPWAYDQPSTSTSQPKTQSDETTSEKSQPSVESKLVEEATEELQKGSTLWKVKSLHSWYSRKYILDVENNRLMYEGSKKRSDTPEVIELREIHDVRRGFRTDIFNRIVQQIERKKRSFSTTSMSSTITVTASEKPLKLDEKCCFSIIYGPDHRTLDLVCATELICNLWVRGLRHYVAVYKNTERDELYKDHFRKADLDDSGALDFEEILTLLHQLNIDMDKVQARKLFDEANTSRCLRDGVDVIDENEFVTFYNLIKQRPELDELFERYTFGDNMMSASQLLDFLKMEQRLSGITEDDAADIIDVYEPAEVRAESFLSPEGFQRLLLSEPMDVFNVFHRSVYHDMSKPLCEYYIASSHNTYLMADQLAGESSVEGYIRALRMGCRCVELDLWDGPNNEPMIYHGFTLTSKILLKDVLSDAIKPYAFESSDFPVILSLENHLCVEQQKVMCIQMRTILGDLLYTEPLFPDMKKLPSPQDLTKKIIIKSKKLPNRPYISIESDESLSGSDDSLTSASEDSIAPMQVNDSEEMLIPAKMDEKEKAKSGRSWLLWKRNKRKKKLKIAEELSDLVNICRAVHFKSFQHSLTNAKCYDISSLNESKAYSLVKMQSSDFIQYNQRQLIRIYPAGRRQGSSNYDPIPLWNVGCQIVALNYQTCDKPMRYNRARFLENGECGYVLKPKFLISGVVDLDKASSGLKYRKILKLRIISGQHIPRPNLALKGEIIDPYVVVTIRGHEEDDKMVKTKHIKNNGFNPFWNEIFFLDVKLPQLAFVHFVVRDFSSTGKDEKLGEYCLPLLSMAPGFRHVHLEDKFYRPILPASIFIHSFLD